MPPYMQGLCESNFLCPKKDGGYHMILSLKCFNKYVHKQKFKMETLEHILTHMIQDCYMTSTDLSDSYLTFPIYPKFWKYFKFSWKSKPYMYITLPFGLTSAPCLFTKMLKPLIPHLRKMGQKVIFYLDDGWQCGDSYQSCLNLCIATYNLFRVWIPPQPQEITNYWDFGICAELKNHDHIPSSGKNTENYWCHLSLLHEQTTPICHQAKIIWKLLATLKAIPLGHLHYRSIEHTKLNSMQQKPFKWDSPCTLTHECILDLLWFIQNLPDVSALIFTTTQHTPFTLMHLARYGEAYLTTSPIRDTLNPCMNGHWA